MRVNKRFEIKCPAWVSDEVMELLLDRERNDLKRAPARKET